MTFHSNPSWDPHQPREVDQFPYVRRSAVGGYGSQKPLSTAIHGPELATSSTDSRTALIHGLIHGRH